VSSALQALAAAQTFEAFLKTGTYGARPAPIVQSHLPVNAIDLSPRGWLVAASDAEALTFVDLQR